MEAESTRPTSITVISWVWIIMGILMILSGLMGFFSFTMMQEMSGGEVFPPDQMSSDFPAAFKPMMIVFRNFQLIAVIQVVVATIAIVSGINFLKCRKWARTSLEILTWLALTYIIVFGIYWIHMWISMTDNIPQDQMPPGMSSFKYFGAIMGVVINLIFGTPLVIMLIKLKGSAIKSTVQ